MLVFIGLILVYGLLFAILAVSKAIFDKDKKPPTSSKSTTQSSRLFAALQENPRIFVHRGTPLLWNGISESKTL